MIKTKRTLLSAILFVLGAMLVCFGTLAMPAKQTLAAELKMQQTEQSAGQTSTMQNDDGSTELNAGEGVAYLHKNWKSEIVINGGTAGDLSTVTSITFNYQADLSGITGYNIGATSVTDTSTPKQSTIIASVNGTNITIYSSQPTVAFPEDSNNLFAIFNRVNGSYVSNLQQISWGNVTIDTSNVVRMSEMFDRCISLQRLDLSGWNTSKTTEIDCMFSDCTSLIELDISNWDVDQVEDMSIMFASTFTESGAMPLSVAAEVMGYQDSDGDLTLIEFATYFANMMGETVTFSSEEDAQIWLEEKMGNKVEDAPGIPFSLTTLNLSDWEISSNTEMMSAFSGLTNLTTLVAPASCAQEIALPVTLYDTEGNEYTSLSSATNGKILTKSLPAAGFDGAELVATTSVGVIALLAVGYALIGAKKKKQSKYCD